MKRGRSLLAVCVATAALFALAATPAISATATAIGATEGQLFSGTVDTFSCPAGTGVRGATINWGDNTAPSAGTVTQANGTCEITGGHTYAEEGSYVTHVSYTLRQKSTDVGSATVGDAQLSANGVSAISVAAGTAVGGVVATFKDPAPESLSSYSATIDWGDGVSSPGSVSSGFTVSGSHTYANGGAFTITVTIRDEGGAAATTHDVAAVSGCSTSSPAAAPPFQPTGSDLNGRYVQALYHDLLGRSPAPGDVQAATKALGSGETRQQLALWMLSSTEYRQKLVDAYYQSLLGHLADAGSLNFLVGLLGSGATDETLLAQVLGSGEYYATRGHNSPDGFLSALYCDELQRPIDQPSQQSAENALTHGTARNQLAATVLGSNEYLAKLVGGYYLRFLRRAADAAGLASWTTFLHSGGTDEQVIASLLSSPEYYALFNPKVTTLTTLGAHGTIHVTLTRSGIVTLTVFRILPAVQHATLAAFGAPRTHRVGIVDFGRHRKGRVTLHWKRKVHGRRLRRGSYVAVLRAIHHHKPYYVSDALPFKVR